MALDQILQRKKHYFSFASRANGWSDTFDLGDDGITIDVSALSNITILPGGQSANVQAGVTTRSMVDTAYASGTRFANPSCNCLSYLGAILGGGLVRTSGLYGWGVDQIISVNLVLASGDSVTLSDSSGSNEDLWWAVRGAGPNFGFITSAVVRAYPIPQKDNVAWTTLLSFNESQLPDLITAIEHLNYIPEVEVDLYFTNTGPPEYVPAILALPLYVGGNETAATNIFAPILGLGTLIQNSSVIPYPQWNAGGDAFCIQGGRKPSYGVAGNSLNPSTLQAVFEEFKSFLSLYGGDQVGQTLVLFEIYSTEIAVRIGNVSPTAYPFRNLSTHIAIIPWYQTTSLDATANAWAMKVRGLLQETAGVQNKSV